MKAVPAGHMSMSHRHSEFGLASSFLGGAMLIIQLVVLSAVVLGVKDNQGIIYAVAVPFFMYCIGVLGVTTAGIGFLQRRRNRMLAKIGFALTLTGPLVFALFITVHVVTWATHWQPCISAFAAGVLLCHSFGRL